MHKKKTIIHLIYGRLSKTKRKDMIRLIGTHYGGRTKLFKIIHNATGAVLRFYQ